MSKSHHADDCAVHDEGPCTCGLEEIEQEESDRENAPDPEPEDPLDPEDAEALDHALSKDD